MSKRELQDQALENSGVSYEESLLASQLTPTVYERLQEDGELCVYFNQGTNDILLGKQSHL